MRKFMKVRLAVFLAIMMILPSIVAILPMTATEVSAANSTMLMEWYMIGTYPSKNSNIEVEVGQEFYIGDYVLINTYEKNSSYNTASMTNATYTSSKKTVATVNDAGYFIAKNPGTTTITVEYKGKKIDRKIKVVSAGEFGVSEKISGMQEWAVNISNNIPSKVTSKNVYELQKMMEDYRAYMEKSKNNTLNVSKDGVLNSNAATEDLSLTYKAAIGDKKLVVPQLGRYNTLDWMLHIFASKNNPTSTRSAKVIKIKSASATTKVITVKLTAKLSQTQVLASRISEYFEQPKNLNKAYVEVVLYDTKSGSYLTGKGEIKKGSNVMKISPMKYKLTKNYKVKYYSTKLTKGRTYRLGSKDDWTKGKTVTVK